MNPRYRIYIAVAVAFVFVIGFGYYFSVPRSIDLVVFEKNAKLSCSSSLLEANEILQNLNSDNNAEQFLKHISLACDKSRLRKTKFKVDPSWDLGFGGSVNLNDADRKALSYYFYRSDSVLEWGLGESTNIAAAIKVSRYTGIDGAITWIEKVQEAAPSHYRFVWADIGTITDWSTPIDNKAITKFPFYSKAALAAEALPFDTYFVDGRFRVACALAAMIHATSLGKKHDEFQVLVHDFRERREEYGALLEVADRVEGCCAADDTSEKNTVFADAKLIVLQKKPEVRLEKIHDLYKKYMYNAH